jgi:hypothetical protein
VRWTPAGGDPRRDAMDASDQRWLRLSGLRSRPEGQRHDPDRSQTSMHLTFLHTRLAQSAKRNPVMFLAGVRYQLPTNQLIACSTS